MEKMRKCGICGKQFISIVYNSKYCSNACKEEANRIKQREYWHKRNAAEQEKKALEEKNKPEPLWKIEAEAWEHGMSYGQYEAKKWLEKGKKNVRKRVSETGIKNNGF